MQTPTSQWRAWRETIPGLSVREVARRVTESGLPMNSGRLSVIERGLVPTEEEAAAIRAVLIAASDPGKAVA